MYPWAQFLVLMFRHACIYIPSRFVICYYYYKNIVFVLYNTVLGNKVLISVSFGWEIYHAND